MENEVSYRQVGREKGYVPPPRLKDEGAQRKAGGKRDAFGIRTERFSKPTVCMCSVQYVYEFVRVPSVRESYNSSILTFGRHFTNNCVS